MEAINQKFNIMRVVVCIVIFLLSLNTNQCYAQKHDSINKIFIRVYDFNDKKIGAGRIAFINDSVVALKKSEVNHSYFLKDIGKIKTKKSGSNNILKGALIGAGVGTILGVAAAEPDDGSWGYSAGELSLIHISEPTRLNSTSRMPSSA